MMDPELAVAALRGALDDDETSLVVADIDWTRFLPTFTMARRAPLLDDVPEVRALLDAAEAADRAAGEREDVSAIRRHLTALPPGGARRAALGEFVLGQVATVLGYASPDELQPGQSLPEAGFDSLMSIRLRNRLAEATGLTLPPSIAFAFPTASAIAEHLDEALGAGSRNAAGAEPADTLEAFFRAAWDQGRIDDGYELMLNAARLRPTFTRADQARNAPPVRLARGDTEPIVIAFSTFVAIGGAQEYARLASHFRGRREVAAMLPHGFERTQPLPADVDVFLAAQADAVLRHAAGRPFVLAGLSSGGTMAHAVAAQLERDGHAPAGVILLDVYFRGEDIVTLFEADLNEGMFAREDTWTPMTTPRLTAASWYLNLFGGWVPPATTTPTLLVRASEPFATTVAGGLPGDWQARWDLPHTAIDVPGNHFTIVEDHAESTARAMEDWLTGLG